MIDIVFLFSKSVYKSVFKKLTFMCICLLILTLQFISIEFNETATIFCCELFIFWLIDQLECFFLALKTM